MIIQQRIIPCLLLCICLLQVRGQGFLKAKGLLIVNEKGEKVKLDEPTGLEFPPKGFAVDDPATAVGEGVGEEREDGGALFVAETLDVD